MGMRGVGRDVAAAIIRTVDPSGDGQMDYSEFLKMLQR